MNKKTKISLTTFLVAVPLCVSCCILAATNSISLSRAKSALAVDSWYEKAYVAPTGSDVGYKHYYLGCPGNARTSDAAHENNVTLEEITIPALNVISSSAVTEGSQILNVRNEKIRWVDQCTDITADGGTPVYVSDAGHQAVFFSRSNNLTDAHASEFRFTPGVTMNGLKSVTFDYRYLDYNTAVEAGVSTAHIYTQFHIGSYINAYYDFVNDDQWHSATIYTDASTTDGATEFLINIFDFQGHIYISNLEFHGFNEMNLEAASALDAIAPVTLSDFGIADNTNITPSHLFGNYDFLANKGMDLWFSFNYQVASGDTQLSVYFFNQYNEEGIKFRVETSRTEDDGIAFGYIINNNTSDINHVIFPKTANIKSGQEIVVHMFAYLIDPTDNTFTVGMQAGVSQMYNPVSADGGSGYEVDSPLYTKDFTLGASYFDGGLHRVLRVSEVNNTNINVSSADSQEQLVVYKDADGTVMGKKAGTTINTFDYHKAGKQLVGWFDQHGHKVTNGQTVTSKTVVQPLFVDQQTDMLVPSDIMMGTKGQWYNVNSTTVTGETASGIGYAASSNRVDMYFIYEPTAITGADNWAVFGFPYDFLDAKSRLRIRINENNNNNLDGFVFGGSLGNEGAEGTYFNLGSNFRHKTDQILVHMSVVDNGSNNVSFTLECTNLRTREVGSAVYSVTFTQYAASEGAARNKMCLLPAVGCEWRFIDAF